MSCFLFFCGFEKNRPRKHEILRTHLVQKKCFCVCDDDGDEERRSVVFPCVCGEVCVLVDSSHFLWWFDFLVLSSLSLSLLSLTQ